MLELRSYIVLVLVFGCACSNDASQGVDDADQSTDTHWEENGKITQSNDSSAGESILGDVSNHAESDFRYFVAVFEDPGSSDDRKYDALKRLEKSAINGHAEAQLRLGFMLNTGTVLPQNKEVGLYWLLLAAQQENVDAQRLVGAEFVLRSKDEQGEKYTESIRNAEYWLRRASHLGDIESKSLLGKILVQRSETRNEGMLLLSEAASAGSDSAEAALSLINSTSEEDVTVP